MADSRTGKAEGSAVTFALVIVFSITLGTVFGSYKYSDTEKECTQKFRVCKQVWVGSAK